MPRISFAVSSCEWFWLAACWGLGSSLTAIISCNAFCSQALVCIASCQEVLLEAHNLKGEQAAMYSDLCCLTCMFSGLLAILLLWDVFSPWTAPEVPNSCKRKSQEKEMQLLGKLRRDFRVLCLPSGTLSSCEWELFRSSHLWTLQGQ